MSAVPRWLLYGSTVLAAATGLVYGALRYLLENDDPFSAYNHPAQPWALHLHVLGVPVLLFAVGWFWGRHVLPKLANGRIARPSGLTLLGLVVVMSVSGYLLQVVASSAWHAALAWTHGVSGTVFTALLAAHVILGRRAASRAAVRERSALSYSTERCDKVAAG